MINPATTGLLAGVIAVFMAASLYPTMETLKKRENVLDSGF